MSGAMPSPAAGAMPPPDPGMMAPPDDAGASDTDDNVLVTICKNDDGSYTVYAGDEPEGGDEGDMSEDDANAMGAAGAAPAPTTPQPQGQPADSVGAALKIALDILNSDKSSEGAPGNADDQFNAGFSADKSPTPASGMAQKY